MKTYTGINIQWPISEQITSGKKVVETRTYPIPEKYLNEEMAMVETPGPIGKFKARVVAIIKFTNCFKYIDKEDFYLDMDRHLVTPDSIWKWNDEKPKWGWEVQVVKVLIKPVTTQQKGIVYRSQVEV